MKDATTISVILVIAILATLTALNPQLLAQNEFLKEFVTHEILAFLIIILTITFASVANIHLSISRTQTSIQDAGSRASIEEQFAKPLRAETRSSAWLLFWMLVLCTLALLVKGQFPRDEYVVSGVYSIAIVALLINALVIYDIYNTIFVLVGAGPESRSDAGPAEFDAGDTPQSKSCEVR